MARLLMALGALLLVLGVVVWALERVGLHPGRLPGDIAVGSGNVRLYFPLGTSLLLSLLLTGVLWLVSSLRR